MVKAATSGRRVSPQPANTPAATGTAMVLQPTAQLRVFRPPLLRFGSRQVGGRDFAWPTLTAVIMGGGFVGVTRWCQSPAGGVGTSRPRGSTGVRRVRPGATLPV